MTWQILPVSEFKFYSDKWDQLNDQSFKTPLLSSNFVIPILEYFANGKDKLVIHGDPQCPDAMAIITMSKFGAWETLQPSQAPLGLWLQKATLSTACLLAQLQKTLPFPTLLIGVTQQDPDLLPRPEQSTYLKTLDYIQTARVTLNGDFDCYWAKRGKNLRQNINRQHNRLERNGVKTSLKVITEVNHIKQAIIDYGKMESAGWKNAGGTAIHIDNKQGKFYLDMLTNFGKNQDCLIFQYYYDDQLVASDLCIKDAYSLIILKTTYEETITDSSPAILMRKEEFEYVFNHKLVEKIEFYGKVMDWHTKWSDEFRLLFHINNAHFFTSKIIELKRRFIA